MLWWLIGITDHLAASTHQLQLQTSPCRRMVMGKGGERDALKFSDLVDSTRRGRAKDESASD